MLTLYEAIVRFEALSKANRSRAESYNRGEDYELMKAKECETCADECDQVASWLEELKQYRGKVEDYIDGNLTMADFIFYLVDIHMNADEREGKT